MTARNAAQSDKVTIANIHTRNLNANEAAAFLPLAARMQVDAEKAQGKAKERAGCAKALIIAAFTSPEFTGKRWSFDVVQGGDVAHHVETDGAMHFFEDDRNGQDWARNGEGAISKAASTAYKAGFFKAHFGMAEPVASLWTTCSRALPIARAILSNGGSATVESGKLVIHGKGEKLDALRTAAGKSLAALEKACKGDAGQKGERNGRKAAHDEYAEGEARPASPAEISAALLAIAKLADKGEAALCNAALENIAALVRLVQGNPDAFKPD